MLYIKYYWNSESGKFAKLNPDNEFTIKKLFKLTLANRKLKYWLKNMQIKKYAFNLF